MSECGGEVVLTDFGCCWANSKFGFKCPYITEDVDKGGNAALMAPEVANATPGTMAKISLNSLLKKNRHYLKCFLTLNTFTQVDLFFQFKLSLHHSGFRGG